jgi:hypothetical protein
VGGFFTVRLTFNVPATVQRFSSTEAGSVNDRDGAPDSLSHAQSIIAR